MTAPQGEQRRAAVATMLGAKSIAVVGASPRAGSFGARMIEEAHRSSATVHLVNPRYDRIGDLPCVPSLADLDGSVDLILLGVPDQALLPQLQLARETGARSAVVFGAANGAQLRADIAAAAQAAGMALCGAGCMGFVNNALGVRALGYLEPDPIAAGGVSLITHSGSAFSTLLRARRGFGFRLAVSSGQELVTDTADYLDYALDDPDTTLIGLLLETPRCMPRLRSALSRAAHRDVPVVLLPVGSSPRGRAMVAAHSGALAGDDGGWSALCAATGAVRVSDLSEFTDALELFAAKRRCRAETSGIVTVHDSGAERALCADLAHELDVPFAELSDSTVARVGALLDDGLMATNPLDVWGTGADTRALFSACLIAMVDDPAVAVTALAVDLVTEYDDDTAYADAVLDVAGATDAPLAVLASVPSAIDQLTAQRLRAGGVPVLEGTRSGLAALGHLARWPLRVDDDGKHDVDPQRQSRWRARLNDSAPFDLLAAYGIAVPASQHAATVDAARAAAAVIGYPVALKTAGAAHKSDVGGVVLDIGDPAALTAAYHAMSASLGPEVTVDEMIGRGIEVSVGLVRDPTFGPLLVVAAGGIMIELIADRVVAMPPISQRGALRMLDSLRIAPLLAGWRGSPGVDLNSLADVIVGFSQLAMELGDDVDAVEANPVIASPRGAVAVDALVLPRSQKIE